jgi:hypothetical protein
MQTKAHLCFLKKVGGCCGCVYGTKGAVDRKRLGTTGLQHRHPTFLWRRATPAMVGFFAGRTWKDNSDIPNGLH